MYGGNKHAKQLSNWLSALNTKLQSFTYLLTYLNETSEEEMRDDYGVKANWL